MKKLILLLSVLLSVSVIAQDKTINLKALNDTWYSTKSSSTFVDTLTSNQDTLDISVGYYNKEYVKKVGFSLLTDTIAGADTISVELLGYDFSGDATADVIIAKDTLELGGLVQTIKTDDYYAGADEFSYRFYTIRLIKVGVGDGIKVKEIQFKTYVD